MRAAVIGAKGQLGSDLVSRLGKEAIPLDHSVIDITDPDSVWKNLDRERPDAVINCAAYNFVDKAESDRDSANAGQPPRAGISGRLLPRA